MKKKILSVIFALAFALILVGCGGMNNEGGQGEIDIGRYIPQNSGDKFDKITEQDFFNVAVQPSSSFRMSVSTSSYTYARNVLKKGQLPQVDSIRIEDFVNYFDYDMPAPQEGTFGVYSNVYDCAWNDNAKLLRLTVKAKEIAKEETNSNLVFLIDTSGSMYGEDRLELIKKSFGFLVDGLGKNDKVSIVTYAGTSGVVLSGESGANKSKIMDVVSSLDANGSTAGASGISTAYSLARDYFIKDGNNRVILATDGDFNVGVSSKEGLTELIKAQRESGIFFTGIGVGFGNYNDVTMTTLANNGNGQALYIDNLDEAKRVFTKGLTGTLYTVAKDAKTQVVFNPLAVEKYRLIGYDNLTLSTEEFDDEKTDAGEIGSGHIVTAVYELIPVGGGEGEFATAEIRYKNVDSGESESVSFNVNSGTESNDDKFISCVIESGLLLRNSKYKGAASYDSAIERMQGLGLTDKYKLEFLELISKAKAYAM